MDGVRARYRAAARGALIGTAAVVAASGLLMLGLLLLARAQGRGVAILLFNPAHRFDFWPFAGLVLHIGVFAMGAAGVICLFAALHARRDRAMLAAAGAFSLLLAADDFFMLHQYVLPRRGIPTEAVYAAYAALASAGVWHHRRRLAGLRGLAILVALGLFAGSLAVDLLGASGNLVLVVEDGFKFTGFVLWSSAWILWAHRAMAARFAPARFAPARFAPARSGRSRISAGAGSSR